ncbi:hypothetical protein EJ03DRAFT_347267 [Teratosphaeria nubilosa]|uniref:RING-type domain-containing protein n=1 Tax=Teratosphaeria nubilosa TaxID=161662 RepID=A0A6G1LNX3_9PEZI|nr:hypothetical protein EJ03DRAFT_347267 [Teratosphaeria nubilosa]
MPNPLPDTPTILDPLFQTALALTQIDLNLDFQRQRIAEIEETIAQIRETLGIPCPSADQPLECPIHLGPIPARQSRTLPCGHVFCRECIARWLQHSTTCPLDRSDAFTGAPRRYEQQQRHDSLHELEANDVRSAAVDELGAHPATLRVGEIDIPLLPRGDLGLPLPALPDVPTESSRRAIQGPDAEEDHVLATDPSSLVERIAFHERLIDELRALQARATRVMDEGSEVELNGRWRGFLETEVDEHWVQARVIQDCVEGLGIVGQGDVEGS